MNCPNGCGEMEYDFEGAGYECLECGEFVGDEETNPQNELRSVVATLRELQHDKEDKAGEATTAQSRKYNQGAAYAYAISANTIEGVLDGDE